MFCRRLPAYMTDGAVLLRPMKISDGPYLRKQMSDREAPSFSLLSRPVSGSWFRVWLNMKKIFNAAYIITIDHAPSGFAGLYNLAPGQSVEISLVIFDREKRGRGFGIRAFTLIADNLQKNGVARRILVSCKSDNTSAQSFWSRCGFHEHHRQGDLVTLYRDLVERDQLLPVR